MRLPVILALLTIFAGTADAAQLTVTVLGAGPSGPVRGMIFPDAISFDKRQPPLWSFSGPAIDGKLSITVNDLPAGAYALIVYQDVSGHGSLDMSAIGRPLEPYGFSNDASGLFGPPGFNQAALTLGEADLSTTIHLRQP